MLPFSLSCIKALCATFCATTQWQHNVQEDEHEGQTPENPLASRGRRCCLRVCVLVRVCFEGHEEPHGTLQLQGLQTGWHPQSSFFILETAVVSVTTRVANEGEGGEAVEGVSLCLCVCV